MFSLIISHVSKHCSTTLGEAQRDVAYIAGMRRALKVGYNKWKTDSLPTVYSMSKRYDGRTWAKDGQRAQISVRMRVLFS